MSFADASQTRLSYVVESTFGTIPTSPAFQNLRFTGESLQYNTENIVSNEIRADRNIPDLIKVGNSTAGGFDFEMSYGTFDDLFESVMFSTFAANVLKNGTTRKTLTFEKTFETGAIDAYLRFRGSIINGMSLNFEAGQIVTGAFDILGLGGSAGASALSGATYTAATTTAVMNAADGFAALNMGGSSPTPCVQAVTLAITNNLRPQRCLGAVDLHGIGTGRFEVTGSVRAFFENLDLYNLYLNGTASAMTWTVGNTAGQRYNFNMPNIKFETGNILTPGNDQDVVAELTYRGLFDGALSPNNDATLIITRGV
jgi:hypothetical protein